MKGRKEDKRYLEGPDAEYYGLKIGNLGDLHPSSLVHDVQAEELKRIFEYLLGLEGGFRRRAEIGPYSLA